jgi:hypothetical protein
MTSWRDAAPQPVQDDLDDLFTVSLDAAEAMLAKRAEFFPFGFGTDLGGTIGMFAADPGLGEHPPSADVLSALAIAARTSRDRLRAVSTTYDVRISGGRDAVCVDLEHREGQALRLLVPYRRSRLRRSITFDDMVLNDLAPSIWTDGEGPLS